MKRVKPVVRIKQWSPGGQKRTKTISLADHFRARSGNVQHSQPRQSPDQGAIPAPPDLPSAEVQSEEPNEEQGPSRYYFYRQKVVDCWAQMRDSLLHVQIESAVPQSDLCVTCEEATERIIRCMTCGPHFQECLSCAEKTHRNRPFHYLEEWTVHKTYSF